MIEIIGYFKNHTVSRVFDNVLDAIDYRDKLDAHYVNKVEWIQEESSMWPYTDDELEFINGR